MPSQSRSQSGELAILSEPCEQQHADVWRVFYTHDTLQILFSVNKLIELPAIENSVHFRCLNALAVSLNHFVGMEHIRADLAPPFHLRRSGNVHFCFFRVGERIPQMLDLRRKEFERALTVLQLRTLRRSMHREVGRNMNRAHRPLALVYILPSCAAGACKFETHLAFGP